MPRVNRDAIQAFSISEDAAFEKDIVGAQGKSYIWQIHFAVEFVQLIIWALALNLAVKLHKLGIELRIIVLEAFLQVFLRELQLQIGLTIEIFGLDERASLLVIGAKYYHVSWDQLVVFQLEDVAAPDILPLLFDKLFSILV